MKIIIPMAGRGSRFYNLSSTHPEYAVIKPFIKVKGVPMIKWATASYPFLQQSFGDTTKPVKYSDLVFICLQEHEKKYQIAEELKRLYAPETKVIFVKDVTRGAAETALQAKDILLPNEEIIISDSDHHFDASPLWKAIQNKDKDTVGILPVIEPPDTKPTWSYVNSPDNKYVIEVKEKDPELAKIGYGILGGYYFSQSKFFFEETKNMIAKNDLVGEVNKKEFYVSQVYSRLIKKGKKIEMVLISQGWVLGTPEHLDYFLKNFKGDYPFK